VERSVLHPVRASALLVALALVAGCSARAATTTSSLATTRSSTSAVPARSLATTTTAMTTTTTTAGATTVSVALDGLPSSIRRGAGPVAFRIVLTNDGDAPVAAAPLFELVGPPCNCVAGSLERLDRGRGVWLPAPLPEGDGYDPLERAEGPEAIAPHASVTIDERITVSAANAPKAATALAYAVDVATHRQLGAVASVPVEITR